MIEVLTLYENYFNMKKLQIVMTYQFTNPDFYFCPNKFLVIINKDVTLVCTKKKFDF